MEQKGFIVDYLPELKEPLLIGGFEGWGNALDISSSMVAYLIRSLNADVFARINSDLFYRFDENRPIVDIREGVLRSVAPPGGGLYAARSGSRDLVLLKAREPDLQWYRFAREVLFICRSLKVKNVIALGSMYDSVLHSDVIISGTASSEESLSMLKGKDVIPITYKGPSAIHSVFQQEAGEEFDFISLWCHCPYYLQGTTHFGLLSALGTLLSEIGGFELDVAELHAAWTELNRQIEALLEKNPELQAMVSDLRKAKIRGSWADIRSTPQKSNVIHLKDFLKPR